MSTEVKYKRSIQYAMFANESALMGAWLLFIGGVISIIGGLVEVFEFWLPIGIYSTAAGLLLVVIEYPRGKKNKGSTVTREFQDIFTKILYGCNPIMKNYYVRAMILLLTCGPGVITAPTFFGASCLAFASAVYMVAAINGEKWIPVGITLPGERPTRAETISNPPNKPPPRLPTIYKKSYDSINK